MSRAHTERFILFLNGKDGIRISDLPDELRNPDVLRLVYAEGLVEIGKQRDPFPGEFPQTPKWDFWSQTAGDWPLTESLAESSDWYVRLTTSGNTEASRLRLEAAPAAPAAEDGTTGEQGEPKGKRGGRPADTDAKQDAAIAKKWAAWPGTKAELNAELKLPVGSVHDALERHRKRKPARKN